MHLDRRYFYHAMTELGFQPGRFSIDEYLTHVSFFAYLCSKTINLPQLQPFFPACSPANGTSLERSMLLPMPPLPSICGLDPKVGEAVSVLVAFMPGMAPHPMPVDFVALRQAVELFP
jgi:hypothetical protein